MVVGMMDNLRKFCEENNIECHVDQAIDEPVRVSKDSGDEKQS